MELLDRAIQRQILLELAQNYPDPPDRHGSFKGIEERQLEYNLFYLKENRLVAFADTHTLDGKHHITGLKITATGIDFISDDGGLSAILGVVTIKLHEDTVRWLLIQRIESSDETSDLKVKLIKQIRELPSETLKQISNKAIETGIAGIPTIGLWLAHFIS